MNEYDSNFLSIVAINGEGGHWAKSWTDSKTGFCWLQDGLPQQFPAARIYSYSPRSTLDNVAETLLIDLLDERSIQGRSELPIVLLGLSLGGTLAKKLFVESSPSRNSKKEVKELHSKIVGFVFMGTRHSGTFEYKHLATLNSVPLIFKSILRSFDQVPGVNSDFKMLKGEQLPLACFYETEAIFHGVVKGVGR